MLSCISCQKIFEHKGQAERHNIKLIEQHIMTFLLYKNLHLLREGVGHGEDVHQLQEGY